MAKKAVVKKEKYAGHKGPMPDIEVKTPYPEKHKKSDVDFIGNELVSLTNRVNELELSLEEMRLKIKVVSGRMGL